MRYLLITLLSLSFFACKTTKVDDDQNSSGLLEIGGKYYTWFLNFKWNKKREHVFAIAKTIENDGKSYRASCWYYRHEDISNGKKPQVTGITGRTEGHYFIEDRKIFDFLEQNEGQSVSYTYPWYLYSDQYSTEQKMQFATMQSAARTQKKLNISEQTVKLYQAIVHELHANAEGAGSRSKNDYKLVEKDTLEQVVAIVSSVHTNSFSNINKGVKCPVQRSK